MKGVVEKILSLALIAGIIYIMLNPAIAGPSMGYVVKFLIMWVVANLICRIVFKKGMLSLIFGDDVDCD